MNKECMRDLEHRTMEITQSEQQKEKQKMIIV